MAWLAVLITAPTISLLATQTNPPVALFINGPTNNRVNLVFLAEGYQTNQLAQFLVDATNAANSFLAVQPYAEYHSNFNAFAIGVSSINSGSTHPAEQITNKTYFNSSYDPVSDFLITIPNGVTGQGQDRVNGLLKTFFGTTNYFLPVVLVNDPSYPGGSDNSGTAAITDNSSASLNTIFIHETGHVLGNLGDEYSMPLYTNYPNVEEPNTTTNITNIKWSAWIPSGTPIPTPANNFNYLTTVGLFLGAHYQTNGWYRPWRACIMENQNNANGFCPVCQETLVLAIYGKMRPIDSYWPATNKIVTASAQPLNFSLSLVPPATHGLTVQWFTNTVSVPGATNSTFSLAPKQLGTGTQTNTISAVVWDNTPMVRTDPKNIRWQTNLWNVVTTLPTLLLDKAKWTTNANLFFRITGNSPDGVVVEGSTNFINWLPLQTNLFAGQTNYFYTNFGGGPPWRFFRAVTPP